MNQKPKKVDTKKVKTPAAPTVVEEIQAFVTQMRQLRRAQSNADAGVLKREKELGEARRNLAAAQSATLIQNPDIDLDGIESAESNAFVTASLELEQAKAARSGMLKRIAEHDIEILTIAEKLKAERAVYNAQALEAFTGEVWEPARTTFAAVLRLAAALSSALGVEVPDAATLPDAGDDWTEDPEAKALHDQNCELKTLANDLEKFRGDAERRVRASEGEKRMLARAPFDADARYKVRKPFTAYSKNYAIGELVDAKEVPIGLLSRLHSAGCLITITREEW